MKTSARKKIGWLLFVLALGTLAGLAFSNVHLVKVTSKPLPATGTQTHFILAHWSLGVVCLAITVGIGLIIFPRREKTV